MQLIDERREIKDTVRAFMSISLPSSDLQCSTLQRVRVIKKHFILHVALLSLEHSKNAGMEKYRICAITLLSCLVGLKSDF